MVNAALLCQSSQARRGAEHGMSAHVFNSHRQTHAPSMLSQQLSWEPKLLHTDTHTLTYLVSLFTNCTQRMLRTLLRLCLSVCLYVREKGGKAENSCVLTLSKSNRNGEAAQSTILWAGKLRPPAARVQSTRSPWHRNNCMAETKEVP